MSDKTKKTSEDISSRGQHNCKASTKHSPRDKNHDTTTPADIDEGQGDSGDGLDINEKIMAEELAHIVDAGVVDPKCVVGHSILTLLDRCYRFLRRYYKDGKIWQNQQSCFDSY